MHGLYVLLGVLAGLAGFGATIFILVQAFMDEVWKGVLGLLCGLYLLYFAIFDWDHEWKWPIVLLSLFGNGIAVGLFRMA